MNTRALTAAAAGAAAGVGLWATLGSLDRVAGPDGPVRVAMLPSLATLALLALGGAALFALVVRALPGRAAHRAHDASIVLAGAAAFVLPYLPWVADRCPALMLLAGPGALPGWGVLAGLAAWAVARPSEPLPDASRARRAFSPRALTGLIFAASLASSGFLASRFVQTPLFPGGDEPHYLVIAQSIWRDHDLQIENNHKRGDYYEYFHRPLTPHYLTRGVDRQIYSIHPIGMPVLMTPVYAAGGYRLVVTALLLLAALAVTTAWRLAWAVTGSAGHATFGWAVLALGAPWVFNTFSVYPEVPAACAVALAFAWTSGWRPGANGPGRPIELPVWRWWASGAAIGCLPWFSTKYVVMGAVLGVVALLRIWLPWPADAAARRRALMCTVAVIVPAAILLGLWFGFFKWIWGKWSPSAPYGAQRETKLAYLPSGAPGLLFDQEYGIVAFAPALVMVLPGVIALWRRGGAHRRLVSEIVAVFAGLLGVVGAFHIWWGGSAMVGRPVVSGLPLLLIPVAAQWAATEDQPLRRALQRALLFVGVVMTVLLATVQDGLLLVAGRDGASQVLEYLTPSTPLWTMLPSFLRQSPAQAWAHVALWGGAALVGGWLFGRVKRGTPATLGVHHLMAWTIVVAVGAVLSAAARVLPESTPPPALDARARVRMLDTYDATARPLAIRYDPLTRIDPADVPPMFPLLVHPAGDRTIDRATNLFGRRLSLPAGTYDIELAQHASTAADGELKLHAGRLSPPLETWPVTLAESGAWGRAFSLPVDVGFVGFKAVGELVEASPALKLTPRTIVDVGSRPRTPAVLGSARYGDLLVLVHGDDAWPEPEGLWVRGATAATLTVVMPPAELVLDLRAGPKAVNVDVDGSTVSLEPGATHTLTLPAVAMAEGDATVTRQIRIHPSSSFVPAEVEPGSRDRRPLGCWITLRLP